MAEKVAINGGESGTCSSEKASRQGMQTYASPFEAMLQGKPLTIVNSVGWPKTPETLAKEDAAQREAEAKAREIRNQWALSAHLAGSLGRNAADAARILKLTRRGKDGKQETVSHVAVPGEESPI